MYNLNFLCFPFLPKKKIVATTYDSTLVYVRKWIICAQDMVYCDCDIETPDSISFFFLVYNFFPFLHFVNDFTLN